MIFFNDDILIYLKSEDVHMDYLRVILQVLNVHKLYAKFSKCVFRLFPLVILCRARVLG